MDIIDVYIGPVCYDMFGCIVMTHCDLTEMMVKIRGFYPQINANNLLINVNY